jgi:hypothetical protein
VTHAIPFGSQSTGARTGDASEFAPTGSSAAEISETCNVLMEGEARDVLVDSSAHAAKETNVHGSPVQGRETKLRNNIKKPKYFSDYMCYLTCTGEPESLGEAMEDPKWKEAMHYEYDALMKNST